MSNQPSVAPFVSKIAEEVAVCALSAKQVAERYHRCVEVVKRWIHRGVKSQDGAFVKLESVKCGSAYLTSEAALARFFSRISSNPAALGG